MWMYFDNKKRNKAQGVNRQPKDVPTEAFGGWAEESSFQAFLQVVVPSTFKQYCRILSLFRIMEICIGFHG